MQEPGHAAPSLTGATTAEPNNAGPERGFAALELDTWLFLQLGRLFPTWFDFACQAR